MMNLYVTPTVVFVATLAGTLTMSTPARADHCTIAVTTELSGFIKVRVPNSIYNSVTVLDGRASQPIENMMAHGRCPQDQDRELLFVVQNCTASQIYDYKTFPEDEIDGIPLYIIRGPFDDNFDGQLGDDIC